jgi:imidazolonepropionase
MSCKGLAVVLKDFCAATMCQTQLFGASVPFNPGSSPMSSLLLAMNMACTLFRLTPAEALLGATRHAALALGLPDHGSLEQGKVADLAVCNCAHPSELAYRIGFDPLHKRILGGVL